MDEIEDIAGEVKDDLDTIVDAYHAKDLDAAGNYLAILKAKVERIQQLIEAE